MKGDHIGFFRSQSIELAAKAKRVRNLIGDRHWYTDGAFKEALLLDAVRLRLPSGMEARRGFVMSDDLSDCSTEQDCLIVDRLSSVPIFEAVDFHMVAPRSVAAIISVKTKLQKAEFIDAAKGVASALQLIASDALAGNPFAALFTFDEDTATRDETIADWIRELLAKKVFPIIRSDPIDGERALSPFYAFTLHDRCVKVQFFPDGNARVLFYKINDVSAAVFLYLLERGTFEARNVHPVAAWSALDDDRVATLTSTTAL
jgi:hypothetical protein